jgi:hypothetical protein
MLRRSMLFLLAALTVASAGALPACADPVYPTGLRVGLTPPPGMTVSPTFTGFEDANRKATIKILDLPAGAYAGLEKGVFADAKKDSGVTIEKRESFPFNDGLGFLITFRQQKDGSTHHRWVMIAQSMSPAVPNLTTLIDVDVPEAALGVYSDAVVRAALATVSFRPPPIAEQLRTMPFKLDALAGFRVMRVLPTGAAILIDGPTEDVGRNPYMIIAVGNGAPADASARGEFARQLLLNAPLANLAITSAETIRLRSVPAIEIRAQAKSPHGETLSMIQWVRFGGTGFLRIVGVTQKDRWDELFPRFRAVRDGINERER